MPNISSYSNSQDASERRRVKNGVLDYANNSNMVSVTGANNELMFNSTTREIVIHDNSTSGGARFAVSTPTANSSTLPTANSSYRGHIYTITSNVANTADVLKICVLANTGSYGWKTITIS